MVVNGALVPLKLLSLQEIEVPFLFCLYHLTMSLQVNVYLNGFPSLTGGLVGFGPKFGSTGLVGLGGLGGVGLGGLGGTGIGFGAGCGFGAGGSGLGILVLMYQAWLRPLWQFQKITCLLWVFAPPWTSRHF